MVEDAASDVAAFLISQGPLGVLVLILGLLLVIGARAFYIVVTRLLARLESEISAHNDTREKRRVESWSVIEAVNRLEKRDDLLLTLIRSKGER